MNNICFHERTLGEKFNFFPAPGEKMPLPDECKKAVLNHQEFKIGDLTFDYLTDAHNLGWWAWNKNGAQCAVTFMIEGRIYP